MEQFQSISEDSEHFQKIQSRFSPFSGEDLEQFLSSLRAFQKIQSSFRAVSKQFRSSFRAVSEHFRSTFGALSEQFQSSFIAISEQFHVLLSKQF